MHAAGANHGFTRQQEARVCSTVNCFRRNAAKTCRGATYRQGWVASPCVPLSVRVFAGRHSATQSDETRPPQRLPRGAVRVGADVSPNLEPFSHLLSVSPASSRPWNSPLILARSLTPPPRSSRRVPAKGLELAGDRCGEGFARAPRLAAGRTLLDQRLEACRAGRRRLLGRHFQRMSAVRRKPAGTSNCARTTRESKQVDRGVPVGAQSPGANARNPLRSESASASLEVRHTSRWL